MTLLAAFQALLARYTGQKDIAVGTPTAGRNHPALEDLIGFFVNTLVLRTDLSDDPTFRELLARVRQVSLGAYDHQELPFEQLVEDMRPERHLNRNPLVQILFQLMSFSGQDLTLCDLDVSGLSDFSGRVRFDLEMHLWQPAAREENLRGTVVYSTDLFDAATIERLVGHYVTLLEGVVADADQRLSALPLLTEAERQQVLLEWNDTAVAYPRDKCVHELFEEQVERTPDAVAVTFEGQVLTYGELNRRANQLARSLQRLGVLRGDTVAISLPRGPHTITAILAVWKAGAAYLFLDPVYPIRRLAGMVADARPAALIAETAHLDLALPTVQVPRGEVTSPLPDVANLDLPVSPEDKAYLIYTSGSTGQPKGTVLRHRGLCNLSEAQQHVFAIQPGDRVLQFASFSFDASVFEMVMALRVGASLVVVDQASALSGPALVQLLREREVTIATLPPSVLATLRPQPLPALRTLIVAGEPCAAELVAAWAPGRRFFNAYGPTETTVWATVAECTPERAPTIGRPILNTRAYVLDQHRQPVPVGVPGELYLASPGLAVGYLNRPELTAERFLLDPFGPADGDVMYRTGDRCRWRADRNLEFLGRLDDQVKLRGFRIELGEIEAVLNQHPSVAHSVVVLREDRAGDNRLVAYCVSAGSAALDVTDLTRHLRNRLPDYMAPSAFVPLEAFPLTPSGKINRRALPAPDNTRPELESKYLAPCNPLEEQLASIWRELLGLARVGIHDNFFALGGHSLLAARVAARAAAALEVELPLRKLFESPTIARLAEEISVLRSGAARSPATPLERVNRERVGRLPLSFAQQRLWFLEQLEGELTAYNLPYAWRLRGPLNTETLRQALEMIVRRHEPLRTTIALVEGEPVQVIGTIERFGLPLKDLRGLATDQQAAAVGERCAEEAERPFDLTRDLLLRASLLRLAEDEHVLLLTLHHIAADGWSIGVLLRELSLLYEASMAGRPSPLAELPVQYIDYVHWQRERLQGALEKRLLDYWLERLRDAPARLDLPTDWARPAQQTYVGARQTVTLSAELTDSIKRLGQQEGTTLYMTVLAVLQLLLGRLSGQQDVVVGSPIADRNRPEVESLIGLFLNLVPLRTDLTGNPTFRELLRRVRATTLGAYDHQDLPFERLVEALNPEWHRSYSPVFQVLLNGLTLDPLPWNVANLSAEPIFWGEGGSKFDLTIYSVEHKGRLELQLVYNKDLFSPERMTCFLDQYEYLLEQVVAAPGAGIDSYSLITPKTRRLFPDPRVALEAPKQVCVSDQIAALAVKMPDQVAICQGKSTWTYGALTLATNNLSSALQACEIGIGDVVAVCGEPSFGLISSVIGVLTCRAALLLIDSNLPVARQQFLLDQAGVKLLIIVGEDRWDLEPLAGRRIVVRVGKATGEAVTRRRVGPVGVAAPSPRCLPDDAAYICFTSGTTGVPKGVVGSHQGLSHFVNWQREQFDVGPGDRVAQVTGLSFDVVLREIFLPLTSGATLCLPERSVDDPSGFWPWLEEQNVTILHAVPSRLRRWLGDVPAGVSLRSFRWLFMAGEPLSHSLVAAWRSLFPGEVINLYGPTETTLAKSWYRVPAGGELRPGVQSIGHALPQTQLLVVSKSDRPCGIGELGEILIRTPFRSLGYLDAHQSQERFVPNPCREDPSDLLYRTGDLGRYRTDNLLEIHGRLDDQVKIRGVRVEPAEIAGRLRTHDHVCDCHVGTVSDEQGERQLVAWVIPSQGRSPTSTDLRRHLATFLPNSLIPSRFVLLESFPLTPSGKINRRALPAPDTSCPQLKSVCVLAPRTSTEQLLAEIWEEVLKCKSVGVHDNFFDLGGHSLLATRVVSRVRQKLKVELPLRAIFMRPTIEGLALYLLEQQAAKVGPEEIESLLGVLEGLAEEGPERKLLEGRKNSAHPLSGTEERTAQVAVPDFRCPRSPSKWFGKRKCNLVIVLNEHFEADGFERVAGHVREFDPCIDVTVARDSPSIPLSLARRPTLIFSPALLRHRVPVPGRVFCGFPLSKSEEYRALEKAGIAVPKWVVLKEGETPDLSGFADYVVRKPDHGGMGAEVVIVRKTRVRWKAITMLATGTSSSPLIQEFIFTGPRPISYRVNTLFGKVLYSVRHEANADRSEETEPHDSRSQARRGGVSIVASARGAQVQPCHDSEIIQLGEAAHAAFPEVPLLGFDIVREIPSGKLYVLEANAIGYVWNFNSHQAADYGFSFEAQYDGIRKAAYILAEKTQECAR
jgi:amino acid adenylation domain-containing protein